ncbi:MAG: adenosylcobalamin-dependent ribonucleoside-diphosphate reductase [Candidatus Marinimicrobia bacterium]|jgi:ribonucleoside-diphosphate reductase alpha chain|nr:adenosylcobalamin-dependent ribonucleoside-diphosphate reductase [Candidatus Neomarinimicrobiota bacterium]MBT3618679.1 adenosylcobalamin-dependent ribonucleoside-diphosphate reductase [Candidatus Neomarinimicrobiota bacterium]MBT3828570.1 adenosylcobalamin-dependent ribonucleoside-diphosphate reductase [Candidatus Neomarinimicrobiota bacterium]MBT3997025.1 adenosylcobalamin-dependent ribonucleoside-diphosphate reductase [Candidatus Neomarinimicrobiota bacterium]MBT4281215.1 adenosylcobalami
MAEAMEFPFADSDGQKEQIKSLVEEQVREIERSENGKTAVPEPYTIESYYKGDNLGADILKNKYLAPWEQHPYQLWQRQAQALAGVEKTKRLQTEWEEKFMSILEDFRFTPGGRIMHGAGRDDITTTLNNCYVVGIQDDSINAIYKTIEEEARTYKFGGGCGHDLSVLRPSGDTINGTGGESCGPVGFMNLFSENTNTIAQHGRRGANMQTLRVDHPDIEKFISIKTGNVDMVKYSNISVLLTHQFMDAVEKDSDFDLCWDGKIYKTIQARKLWDTIIHHAHTSAEPGLLFWETMTDYHNAEYCSPLVSTNPCAEQPLPDGGCCNLGSINLERYVDDKGNFMIDSFKECVQYATRFLDNVIDYNLDRHALETQQVNAKNDRRIGLGILGLGDMLVKMGIKYDSNDALETIDQVMKIFRDTSYETSANLAREKGGFPNFDWEGYHKSKFVKNLPKRLRDKIQENGVRNATILTVPPTGSGAIVAQVTSGIEPIFATSYMRRVKKNDGGYGKTFSEYKVVHPVIEKLFGSDKNLPDHVVTAHDIDPYFRVKLQGVIQKYIDSSISSTVNLPNNIDVEAVGDIYMTAYKEGLKGITVYREGSREGILITDKKEDLSTNGEIDEELQTKARGTKAPRNRPGITQGQTRRIRTGEGSLYITINEDENGLCEIFTTIGKAGGNAAAQSEAISRLISLALRSGINPTSIVKQLKGISGPNPAWEDGRLVLSTPDAIGKALDDYLKDIQTKDQKDEHPSAQFTMVSEAETSGKPVTDFTFKNITTCPDCGSTVNHEAGCVTCPGCGFSKCE